MGGFVFGLEEDIYKKFQLSYGPRCDPRGCQSSDTYDITSLLLLRFCCRCVDEAQTRCMALSGANTLTSHPIV